MFSVDLGQEYKVNIDGGLSKGTQVKYRKGIYWYITEIFNSDCIFS